MSVDAWDELAEPYLMRFGLNDYEFHLGPNGPSASDLGCLPTAHAARVLDVGCGSGANAVYLARQGHDVTAIDASNRQVELAIQRAKAAAVSVRFFACTLSDAPRLVADGGAQAEFDWAYSVFCLEYLRDLDAAMSTVAGLLRPGGTFLYCDLHPFSSWWSDPTNPDSAVRAGYFDEGPVDFGWPRTLPGLRMTRYHRTLETILGAASRAGLELHSVYEPQIDGRLSPAYSDPDIDLSTVARHGVPYTLVIIFDKGGVPGG